MLLLLFQVTFLSALCSAIFNSVRKESYIADIRKQGDSNRVVQFPTSSDITAPYILACNHANGDPKMVNDCMIRF